MSEINRRAFLGSTAALAASAAGTALEGCRPGRPSTAPPASSSSSPLESFGVTEAEARRVMAPAPSPP